MLEILDKSLLFWTKERFLRDFKYSLIKRIENNLNMTKNTLERKRFLNPFLFWKTVDFCGCESQVRCIYSETSLANNYFKPSYERLMYEIFTIHNHFH